MKHPSTPTLIALLSLLSLVGIASAQEPVLPPDWETTDDPRRVPIPPRDRSNDPVLVLRGGTLIDGTGAAPVADAVVVLKGDRVLDV
ncbi:MAG: hypothetical protein ACRD21_16040, partial [Vicinamibacteria bacterium]